jgi:uncharacterized protein
VTAEKGIAVGDRRVRRDGLAFESRPDPGRIRFRPRSTLVAREIDMGQVEQARLTPALGVLFEEPLERRFVDGLGPDTGAHDRLDPIDQAPPNDRVAALHAELDGSGVERFVTLVGLGVEEAHVLDQALVDHAVDSGQPDHEGLVEPEGVFDRLVLEGSHFIGLRGAADLKGEGLDPLGHVAACDLDRPRLGVRAEAGLHREEQGAEEQEMEERRTQQARPFRNAMGGYRNAMQRPSSSAQAASNLALVDRYFELLSKGDPSIAGLFAADACWLAPQSAPVGRRHEGLDAVLALMASGIGLYDSTRPMQIERTASLAGDELVYVEMTIRATTKSGEPYENHYVMAFQIRGGRIMEVREYVDSLYAQRKLFDPVGMSSPLDAHPR